MPLTVPTSAPLVHLSADFIRAKEYLEAIVTSTSDAICTTDNEGRVLYFSPGAEAMFDIPSAEIVGQKAHVLYAGGKAEADKVMKLLRRQGRLQNHELILKAGKGRVIHVSMSASLLRDRTGRVIGTLGISKDITLRVELEQRLRALSITDDLTGLFNQRCFLERLEQEFSRARRQKGRLSMVLIDLDGFKRINDQRGHLEGDRLLREFGAIVRQCVRREVDSAYRYGGDEFIILLPGQGPRGAEAVVRRIASACCARLAQGDLSFSFGVSSYPPSASSKDFVRIADEQLYKMKAGRKDRCAS